MAKDANELLLLWRAERADPAAPTADELQAERQRAHDWLTRGELALLHIAREVGALPAEHKPGGLETLVTLCTQLSAMEYATFREEVARRAGLGVRKLDSLLKAMQKVQAEQAAQAEKDSEPSARVETIGGWVEDHLLETIYIPPAQRKSTLGLDVGQTFLAVRFPDGALQMVAHLDINNVRYVPIPPTKPELLTGVLSLPPGIGESVPTTTLVHWLQGFIHKYWDGPIFYEALAAYYVLFTWIYDVFKTLPYLRLKGDAGTGKSRFLEVMSKLCFRGLYINGGWTLSPIFRTIDRIRGTTCLDEGDFKDSDEAAGIAKILNVGFDANQGFVARSGSRETEFDTEMFCVFGPKVLGTRKEYEDNAIRSRCLTHETGGPTTRTDIVETLDEQFFTEAAELRGHLLRYRLETWALELGQKPVDRLLTLEPRLRQILRPLQQLIDDPDLAADLKAFITEFNRQLMAERGLTMTAKVLEALWLLHTGLSGEDWSVQQIANIVNDLLGYENEWPVNEWRDGKARKVVTAKGVGYIVRDQLGLRTQMGGHKNRYQVLHDKDALPDLEDRLAALWQRYGIEEALQADLRLAWAEIAKIRQNANLPG